VVDLNAERGAQTHLGPDSSYDKCSLPPGQVSLEEVKFGSMNL
jgi:hypothetical protein